MKSLVAFICSTCLVLGMSWSASAEVPSERPTEVFRLESIDPFATENKDPVIVKYPDSVWVTSFVPGLGQILLDEPLRGLLFLGGFLASVPVSFLLGMGISNFTSPNATFLKGMNESLYVMLVLVPGMYIWNLADAYGLNIEKNKTAARAQSLSLRADGQLIWKVSVF